MLRKDADTHTHFRFLQGFLFVFGVLVLEKIRANHRQTKYRVILENKLSAAVI